MVSWLAYRLSLQQTLRNMMEGVITRTRHRMDADLMGMGITITILLGLWLWTGITATDLSVFYYDGSGFVYHHN